MITALLWIAWACVNLLVFLLYGLDKLKATRGKWRIPERTLLTGTWLMGGVGAYLGMRIFRHKTRHLAFRISAPAGAVLSVGVMLALSYALASGAW